MSSTDTVHGTGPRPDNRQEPDAREQLERGLGFLRRARHFWPAALGALLLGCVACAVFLCLRAPRYRSETVIFYTEKGATTETDESSAVRTVTLRLKELLMSRATLERVVNEFDPYPELRRTLGPIEAVEELKKHIDFRAPGGDTISIAFEGSSPVQTQRITAELAKLVIDSDSQLRKSQAHAVQEFLTQERQGSEAQLRDAEQKLAAFMAQHPRFALDATPLTNGAAIRATLGAPGVTGAGLAAPLRMPLPGERSLGSVPSSPAGASLNPTSSGADPRSAEALARASVAAARQNLNEQLLHYTAAHPDVRAAQAALDRATERLVALGASGAASQPSAATGDAHPAETAAAAAAVLRASPAAFSAPVSAASARPEQAKELVKLETDWLTLTRSVTEARQRQDQVEEQLFKADIQASSEGGGHGVQVSIIDPAFLPQRASPPGRSLIAALFFAGSLVLGAFVALLCAAFDDRILMAGDVTISDVLVEVPRPSTQWRQRAAS
jgi:uncharacterized protein involved in exopolysaccharide biosynthesis